MHNTEAPIADELLSAWLDNELSQTERARVDAALAAQPALAARLQQLRLANELTRRHAGAIDQVPLRPALQALLAAAPEARPATSAAANAGAVILPLRTRLMRQWQQLSPAQGSLALAASLLLATVLTFGVLQRNSDSAQDGFAMHAALLEQVASGDTLQIGATSLSPRFSFRATDGNWCRVYRVDEANQSLDNIACREGDAWTLQVSVPAAPQDAGVYVPASSAAGSLDEELDRLMQGAPLALDTEARLLREGWQAPE
jgi:hypothetical protein